MAAVEKLMNVDGKEVNYSFISPALQLNMAFLSIVNAMQ